MESKNLAALLTIKSMFPEIMLVDVGCDIGVFTLSAAKLGYEVLFVFSVKLKLLTFI